MRRALSKTYGAAAEQLLLDEYPNAAVAYSLRELSNASVGSAVVRVRRSSDNAEQDFTATEITDGTLTTFTGANDGFVTDWYDQSGNGNDAAATAASNQPLLVASGVVNTDNGKPYVFLSGNTSSSGLQANNTGIINSTNGSVFAQYNSNDSGAGCLISAQSATFIGVMKNGVSGDAISSQFGTPSPYVNTSLIGTTQNIFYDNMVVNQDILISILNIDFTNGLLDFLMPYSYVGSGNFSAICKVKEMIIYDSDQSTNRSGIETNINTEYTIY